MRKKILFLAICLSLMTGVTACSSGKNKPAQTETEKIEDTSHAESDETESSSEAAIGKEMSDRLVDVFKTEAENKSDIETIAGRLGSKDVCGYDCEVVKAEEGFLSGFNDEINGFKNGMRISPWIGTIPFVCYVFEADDPESLKEELASKANPRWNICTEAEAPVFEIVDNYVFVTMVPKPQE